MSLLDRFFRVEDDTEESDSALADAQEEIAFSERPGYAKLIAWLDDQIDSPVPIGSQVDMISGLSQIGGIRRVRDHLRRRLADAKRMIDRAREERSG